MNNSQEPSIDHSEKNESNSNLDNLASLDTEEDWPIDALVALINSGREELRMYRTWLFGDTAAALLIPISTISVQHSDFLRLFGGYLAWSVAGMWLMGVAILLCGFWLAMPALKPKRGAVNDDSILTALRGAIAGRPHRSLLRSIINNQIIVCTKIIRAKRLLVISMFFFLVAAGSEFIAFLVTTNKQV